MTSQCANCGSTRNFNNPRGASLRTYCSDACRQVAYRKRKIAQGFRFYRGYFYSSLVSAVQGGNHV